MAITREILRVKLEGLAAVAALIRSADASKAISKFVARIGRETIGRKVLSAEAFAAATIGALGETCLSGLPAATPSASALDLMADGALAGPNSGSLLASVPRC